MGRWLHVARSFAPAPTLIPLILTRDVMPSTFSAPGPHLLLDDHASADAIASCRNDGSDMCASGEDA